MFGHVHEGDFGIILKQQVITEVKTGVYDMA